MSRTVSLRAKLLTGFLSVSLLALGLGLLANLQLARVANTTKQGLDQNLTRLLGHQASADLDTRRNNMVNALTRATHSTTAAAIVVRPEWNQLLMDSHLEPGLKQQLPDYASSRHAFLLAQEALVLRLDSARALEQKLHARLLPAEAALVATQTAKNQSAKSEIENLRNDTTTNLFLNFDATVSVFELALSTQSRLFQLQIAEAAGTPSPRLRAELAASLAEQTDPAALSLVKLLTAPPLAGAATTATHSALFKALTEFIANLIFTGRTSVVGKSVESITTMGERTDTTIETGRKFEERRALLNTNLQSLSKRTNATLQLTSRITSEPTAANLSELTLAQAEHLTHIPTEQSQLGQVAAELELAWIDAPMAEIITTVHDAKTGLVAQAAHLIKVRNALTTAEAALDKELAALAAQNQTDNEQFLQEQRNQAAAIQGFTLSAQRSTTLITCVIIVLCLVIAFVLTRMITAPLKRTISDLEKGAAQVRITATKASASSQALSEGASAQTTSIEEISAALEELTSMTQGNATNAELGKASANQARSAAEAGAVEMERLQAAMNAIQQSSTDITKIIKTIEVIAFQTNILALNAAVEAARAGEAGVGFAVVADEVRALAQRSALAAKETATKVAEASTRTTQGVELMIRVSAGIKQILEKNRDVDHRIAAVATASHEQSQGIAQINLAISQMDKITQRNAAGAEESSAAAEELNQQSAELNAVADQLTAMVAQKSQTA